MNRLFCREQITRDLTISHRAFDLAMSCFIVHEDSVLLSRITNTLYGREVANPNPMIESLDLDSATLRHEAACKTCHQLNMLL